MPLLRPANTLPLDAVLTAVGFTKPWAALAGPIARPGTRLAKFGGIRPPGTEMGFAPALPTMTVGGMKFVADVMAGGAGAAQPAGALVTRGTFWKLEEHHGPP